VRRSLLDKSIADPKLITIMAGWCSGSTPLSGQGRSGSIPDPVFSFDTSDPYNF